MSDKLTKREQAAIDALKEVAKKWPKSLWLYVADGQVHVMRKQGGQRVVTEMGGVDQDYIVDSASIESDGGDW